MRRSVVTVMLLLFTVGAFGQFTREVPVSTPVDQPVAGIFQAAIASDGDGFLAAWYDQRDHGSVYAARIARDGTILDPRGIFLANTNSPVVVAWTGDHYLVAWNAASSIMAAEIAADGHLLAPARAIVAKGQISSSPHPIATNGNVVVLMTSSGYSVLDRDANIIENGRFGESAYVTGSGEFLVTAASSSRHLDSAGHYVTSARGTSQQIIACHGSGCLAASSFTTSVGIARYDADALTVGKFANLPIATRALDLVADGDGYLLITDTIAQQLDDGGNPIGASIALPGSSSFVRAAWNGRDAGVLRITSQGLTSFVISSTGVTRPAAVAVSANAQRDVAIARGDTNYLTVWTEKDGTYAGRLSLDGVALDGRGHYLGPNTAKPSVVFDGQSYLAVLQAPFSGYLAEHVLRIDPATGMVMSTASISGSNLRIASNGSERVAVWVDVLGGVVTAFLTPNGALASIPVFLAVPPSGRPFVTLGNPTLTWNGTIWLVTWEEQVHPLPIPQPPPMLPYVEVLPTIAIRAARLTAALTPIDAQPITVASSPIGIIRSSHAATSDGHDFLVAWTSDAIHARRILASGAADADTTLVAGMVQDLVWNGVAYDLAYATGQQPFTPGDLLDARLTLLGQPQETLVISATSDDDRSAALVSFGNGQVLSAYTRVAHEPLYSGVERAFIAAPHRVRGRTARPEN